VTRLPDINICKTQIYLLS